MTTTTSTGAQGRRRLVVFLAALACLVPAGTASTTLASFEATHSGLGLITHTAETSLTAGGASATLDTATGYDAQGRLSTAVGSPAGPAAENTSYAYDPAGTITALADQSTLSYDSAGRPTTRTNPDSTIAATYSYDSDGNRLATLTDPGGTATSRSHAYDAAGRLTAVVQAGTAAGHTYDGDGLRATTTTAGTAAYTWDPTAGVAALLTDTTHRYLYGPAGTVVEQTDTAGGNPAYLHADSLGSTRMLTSPGTEATITIDATWAYSAYGTPTAHTGTATTPFGYAGQYTDTDTGYQYLHARYYDPATGQFLTPDPLQDLTGTAYGYAADNPLQNTDPTGLWCALGGNPNGSCRGGGEYTWAVINVNPVYGVINAYNNEIKAFDNGCSMWTVAKYGAEGVFYSTISVLAAAGGATTLTSLLTRSATTTAAEGADAAATTAGRDLAESCLTNSFTADTPVLMADGKEEPIADVKVGDKVLATDPETGRTEAKPVVALIRHSGKHTMVDLSLSDGSRLTATDHHPFWDATSRTFTDAIDLHVGDRVLSEGGRTLTITGAHVYDRNLTAFNLQIDGIHTYYAGSTPVLVHNSCAGPGESSIWKSFKSFQGKTRSNGLSGSDRQYYEWDFTHNNIEVYNRRGVHLGVMDPETGEMIGGPVNGRVINP